MGCDITHRNAPLHSTRNAPLHTRALLQFPGGLITTNCYQRYVKYDTHTHTILIHPLMFPAFNAARCDMVGSVMKLFSIKQNQLLGRHTCYYIYVHNGIRHCGHEVKLPDWKSMAIVGNELGSALVLM